MDLEQRQHQKKEEKKKNENRMRLTTVLRVDFGINFGNGSSLFYFYIYISIFHGIHLLCPFVLCSSTGSFMEGFHLHRISLHEKERKKKTQCYTIIYYIYILFQSMSDLSTYKSIQKIQNKNIKYPNSK